MTYKEAVNLASTKLNEVSNNHILDAQLLVCHACKIKKINLYAHPKRQLSISEENCFYSVLKRRINGEPLAYIVGKKEFWSLDFSVNENVLIPRPETELLIELILNIIKNVNNPKILDLGTGSGAIAIALAKERQDSLITATDISDSALEIGYKNSRTHNVTVKFIKSDWFENIQSEKFDVIVSNPPYVASEDPNLDEYVLKYEPIKAFISNKQGLQDIESIITKANPYLFDSGTLVLEHGFKQANAVQKLFKKSGFDKITTYQDLNNLDRATVAKLP